MARIRYIKPDFFLDDRLGELPFEQRLAFAGLWCQADRLGRLEDNPKKLKVVLLPYDDVNMHQILQSLNDHKFIIRYQIEGKNYIQIINFLEHQKPHNTEKASTIPEFNGEIHVKSTLNNSNSLDGHSPSPLPIPITHPHSNKAKIQENVVAEINEVFQYFCFKLHKKILLNNERRALIQKRLEEGRTMAEMKTAIDHFAKDDWADRHKFCDIVYVLGVRNKVDNLDKWLHWRPTNNTQQTPQQHEGQEERKTQYEQRTTKI